MDESDVLIPDNFDLINRSEPRQLVSQILFGRRGREVPDKYVPRGLLLLDRLHDVGRQSRRLSPTDSELLPMQGQLLDAGVGVEARGGRAVKEGDEDAGLFG
jgi:hypothetical protein